MKVASLGYQKINQLLYSFFVDTTRMIVLPLRNCFQDKMGSQIHTFAIDTKSAVIDTTFLLLILKV